MIAIIDDGIYTGSGPIEDLAFDLEVCSDLSLKQWKHRQYIDYSHGTTCASIVKHFAPDAVIGSIKILDSKTKSSNHKALIAALQWCITNGIKRCNLSLGTNACRDFDELYHCVQQALSSGMMIVAAQNNNGKFTLPANLDGVLGVRQLPALQENTICMNDATPGSVLLSANIDFSFLNQIIETHMLRKSNSYTAAALSGLIYHCGYLPGESKDALYRRLKSTLPDSFAIIKEQAKPEYSTSAEPQIPVVQIAVQGTKGRDLCLALSRLFRENGSNAVSLTEQPVSSLETEPYDPQDSTQISRVCTEYNADILLIQTISALPAPDIIVTAKEYAVRLYDVAEQMPYSIAIGRKWTDVDYFGIYRKLSSFFQIITAGHPV
ncbi:MAG: S8 family serine peptidase [Christensenellales bacterium]